MLKFLPGKKISSESVSIDIADAIFANRPFLAARFGATEVKAVLYPGLFEFFGNSLRKKIFTDMEVCSGFISANRHSIARFSHLMKEDAQIVDILASWRFEELLLSGYLHSAKACDLPAIEPYLNLRPWSLALAGKHVLVVHPFADTISEQYYSRRELLFENKDVLPEFASLQVFKSVQSLGGSSDRFSDWFSALEFQISSIERLKFDVAIIGCGAYGFPIAAHIKRMSRIAIHLGGATQLLFGIRGRRWDEHPVISHFFNENWVRPNSEERPAVASKVEDACYW